MKPPLAAEFHHYPPARKCTLYSPSLIAVDSRGFHTNSSSFSRSPNNCDNQNTKSPKSPVCSALFVPGRISQLMVPEPNWVDITAGTRARQIDIHWKVCQTQKTEITNARNAFIYQKRRKPTRTNALVNTRLQSSDLVDWFSASSRVRDFRRF